MSFRPFEEVVREHGATVLRVCRALLGTADAEDACSEAFLAALRAYPRLRPGSDVRGWLVTIAHRKAVDLLRGAGRRRGHRAAARDVAAPEEVRAEADPRLAAALGDLPFRQRAAITHHYLAGLAYAEVAVLLGGTAAAARRSAADGIATLRRRLRQEGTVS